MALSGSFANQFQTGYELVCEWSATQDVNNNQSTITLNFYLQSLGSYYTINSSQLKDLQMVIQANSQDQGWVDYGVNYNVSLSGNQKKFMQQKVKTVTHDSNGNCSPILGGMINFNGVNLSGTVFNQVYCQQTVTLDNIPQNSKLASPVPANLTAGATGIPFSITQYLTGATNNVVLYVQDTSNNYQVIATWNNVGTSGTLPLTTQNNTDIFTYLAQRASAPCILRVWTYDSSGAQVGGNQDTTGTMSAPAATTPTLPNFNIGDTLTITLNAANSAFKHTLSVTFGGYTRTLVTQNPNGNYSWNTSLNGDDNGMYQQIPNAQAGIGGIACTTYYNGVQVQSPVNSSNFTATVVNSNPTFSTINYLDNNATYAAFTGNNQYIIQNKSDLLAKVLDANKATAKNYATISKYVATFNGVSITVTSWTAGTDITFDFGTVNVTSNQNLTITVYDSRGFTTTITLNVNIVPYSPPVVNASASRGAGFTSTVTMKLSGTISPCNVNGVNKNGINNAQSTWADGQSGSALGAATAIAGISVTMPNYSAPDWTATMAIQNAWNVQIIITDQISSTTVNLVVPVGVPIMFIDKVMKAIGFGKFPRSGYSIDAASDISTDTKIWEAGALIQDKYAPTGAMLMYGGSSAPSGWLIADGSAVSRTTYSKLFNAIGTAYGAGDGSTTFNLPNLAGRMPVGLYSADSTMNALGKTGGESTHVLTSNEMPSHSHTSVSAGGYYAFGGASGNPAQGAGYGTALNSLSTGSAGGGAAHNNMPPFSVVYFIIKT